MSSFEIKFLVDSNITDQLLGCLRAEMEADTHAISGSDQYRINSLYFDNPSFDVYRRSPAHTRRKYRLRRYNSEPIVYFERKAKRKGRVMKRRSAMGDSDIARLYDSKSPGDWTGAWFQRRLDRWNLNPVLRVQYLRTARVSLHAQGLLRVTVDREVEAMATTGLDFSAWNSGTPLLAGRSIVEFKFPQFMPDVFKFWMSEFGLVSQSVSKYRTGLEATLLKGQAHVAVA